MPSRRLRRVQQIAAGDVHGESWWWQLDWQVRTEVVTPSLFQGISPLWILQVHENAAYIDFDTFSITSKVLMVALLLVWLLPKACLDEGMRKSWQWQMQFGLLLTVSVEVRALVLKALDAKTPSDDEAKPRLGPL